ncbi:MAG: hypothetical protein HY275_05530 [Gemmatimonadetes bacterium]|nr:hypothetical protein [Gemmatimonadota bacterium]
MAEQQTYATHRQWVPLWHYLALPVSLINVFVVLWHARTGFGVNAAWGILVSIAFAATAYLSRNQAIVVQNRLIRLEERLRLKEVLPEGTRGRIGELSISQLVGLRFAPDAELPGLVERCLSGDLANAEAVKKAIKGWRPDTYRA